MKSHSLSALAALLAGSLLTSSAAWAQWGPLGAPVCGDSCVADLPFVIPDGAGGAFIAWRDSRDYPVTDDNVYAQRITAAGAIAPGWPASGLPVSVLPSAQVPGSIAPDGQGGVLVTWYDHRNVDLGTSQDIYAQRVLGNGTIAPGWPVNGAAATRAPNYQDLPAIAADGGGGAYVMWQDWRNYGTQGVDVFAQHLTTTGGVASGWPAGGLAVCALPREQVPDGLIPDGAGGVVLVWNDCRTGVCDIYAQHLLADGTIAPGWVPNGVPVVQGRLRARVAPDGMGGFYVGCATDAAGFDQDYYVQRFTFAGTRAPGWPEGGARVCSAPNVRTGLEAVPDDLGGVLLSWYDYRPSPTGSSEIYALRVMPDGSLAPGWTVNGVRVSDDTGPGSDANESIAPDGAGGAYLAWERQQDYGEPSFVQHLTSSGAVAPGWPRYGVPLAPTLGQFDPQAIEDGTGGAIVVWDEADLAHHRIGLYAQHFRADGPVAVLVSLVSANAEPEGVRLVWQVADAVSFRATVERRGEISDWQALAAVSADGTGRIEYEDRGITSGERYAYRLAYAEDRTERRTTETWVEVPRSLSLTLEGLRPNPAVRELTVSFALPSAAPATLELLDLGGRRLFEREVGSLGAGRHLLRLNEGSRLPPGIYWLRLVHGGRTLTARGVVVR